MILEKDLDIAVRNADVSIFTREFEFFADTGVYRPNEKEQTMIEDALASYQVHFIEQILDVARSKNEGIVNFLEALAAGYPIVWCDGQRLIVENPLATPENVALRGVDQYIVIDITDYTGKEPAEQESPLMSSGVAVREYD